MKTYPFSEVLSFFQPEDSSLVQKEHFPSDMAFNRIRYNIRDLLKTLIWLVISIITGLIIGQLH